MSIDRPSQAVRVPRAFRLAVRGLAVAVWALALSAVIGGCIGGCSDERAEARDSAEAEALPEVEVSAAARTELVETRRWGGRLSLLAERAVAAPHRGVVLAVDATEGDRVEEGDTVARVAGPAVAERRRVLDDRIAHLRGEVERWERLVEEGAAGPAELSEAELRLLDAVDERAELETAYSSGVVRAPTSGRIAAARIAGGTHVAEGDELFRIADAESAGVELSIPAGETGFFDPLEAVTIVDDDGSQLAIRDVDFLGATHLGFVRARIFVADARVDRPRRVEVVYEAPEEVLIVPWTAVAADGGDHWVAIVDEASGEVSRRAVTQGRGHPEGVEIEEGLRAGEWVIRYEPRRYAEGERVEPVESS